MTRRVQRWLDFVRWRGINEMRIVATDISGSVLEWSRPLFIFLSGVFPVSVISFVFSCPSLVFYESFGRC